MEFLAYHGCLVSEKENGGSFVVDFRATVDLAAAAQSDDLADTVDLGAVYAIIDREMKIPSKLIEHAAARIAAAVKREFPQLLTVSVKLTKLAPPLPGPARCSSVTVTL